MIARISVASIYVLDKEEALDFYVHKLGLEKGNDVKEGDYRWLTIRVPNDPGVEISLDALADRAAALPKIDLVEPRSLVGKSTVDAIRSGMIFGYAAMVDGIVGRLREQLGADAKALATGGLAHVVVPFCDSLDVVDDLLTLEGLRLIWDRNRS